MNRVSRWMIVVVLAAVPARIASGQGDSELRVYDVRDLLPLLTEPQPAADPWPADPGSDRRSFDRTPFAADRVSTPALDFFASSLAAAMGLNATPVASGMYAVRASADEHDVFAAAVQSVRERHQRLVRLRIACYSVPSDARPEVGAPFTPAGRRLASIAASVRERQRVPITALREHTYVETFQPVVSTGSTAYGPQVRTHTSGLDAAARVTLAGDRVLLTLDGSITRADIALQQFKVDAYYDSNIGLPLTVRRSINAAALIEAGIETVVLVTDGLDPDTAIVVTGFVQE